MTYTTGSRGEGIGGKMGMGQVSDVLKSKEAAGGTV